MTTYSYGVKNKIQFNVDYSVSLDKILRCLLQTRFGYRIHILRSARCARLPLIARHN